MIDLSFSFLPSAMLPSLIFLLCLSSQSANAQNHDTISIGHSLFTSDPPLLSPSADFAFGFQQITIDSFIISVWYNKLPQKTIVWFANRDTLAPNNSTLHFTPDALILTDPQNVPLWKSKPISDAYRASLTDAGNLVILDRKSALLWESFNEPTDTILPGQTIPTNTNLESRKTEWNFSRGRFIFSFQEDGNLVLYSVNLPTYARYAPYYSVGTADAFNSTNVGYQWVFNSTGYIYIVKKSGEKYPLTRGKVNSVKDYYHRGTLDFDGVFTQYYHPKNFSRGEEGWKAEWTKPDNICYDIGGGGLGSGVCGFNSICSLNEYKRPNCNCPQGFSLSDEKDSFSNCERALMPDCGRDGDDSEMYTFIELQNTNWPTSDYELLKPVSEEQCQESCLRDCMCVVVIFNQDDSACWKKKMPLSNGVQDEKVVGNALIKTRK